MSSESSACGSYFPQLFKGQLISVLIAGTGFFASLLANNNISLPVFLNCINYFLLFPFFFFRVLPSGNKAPISDSIETSESESYEYPLLGKLHCPIWLYVIIALLDLEANVIIVSAYRSTTVTSIMLLDCFSIPCVMILSFFFLKAQYSSRHICGTLICLVSMACIVTSDSISGGSEDARNPVYGDILCLVSDTF